MKLVMCSECGLKYGVYSTFHHFPDDVEAERRRHNCELIQMCRRWEKLIRGPDRSGGRRDGAVDHPTRAEDGAAAAGAVFRAGAAAHRRAEAAACSWTFASAQADRALRHVIACGPGDDAGAYDGAVVVLVAAMARARVCGNAARWARADAEAKAAALGRAVDAVERGARAAGVPLPPRRPVRHDGGGGGGGRGRIVFADAGGTDVPDERVADVLDGIRDSGRYHYGGGYCYHCGGDGADTDDEDDSDEYVMDILNGNYDDSNDYDDDDDNDIGGGGNGADTDDGGKRVE